MNFAGNGFTDAGIDVLIKRVLDGNHVIEELNIKENPLTPEIAGALLYHGVSTERFRHAGIYEHSRAG